MHAGTPRAYIRFQFWAHCDFSLHFPLECAERLVIHLPLLENREDCLRGESSAHELAKNSCRMLLVLRFHQTLALQIFSRPFLITYFVVYGLARLMDDFTVDSFCFQIGDYAAGAKFFVIAAKGRI